MKNVGIIGHGRFGKVLADLLSKKYKVLMGVECFDLGVLSDQH